VFVRIGGNSVLDLVVDDVELSSGGGQILGTEQGLRFEIGDKDPGPFG
jgi:hypothetical protein